MGQNTLLGAFIAAASLLGAVEASPAPSLWDDVKGGIANLTGLDTKGISAAPSGYVPSQVPCPSTRPSIRLADGLSHQEADWLQRRRANILAPMKDLLKRLNIAGLDTDHYIDSHKGNIGNIPNIAIATSGGGWRALLNGAGALAAFDSRSTNATGKGQVGGVLQSATYLAGLSGGSWLVGSVFMNNFSTTESLLNTNPAQSLSDGLWQFQRNILEGPEHGTFNLLAYVTNIWRAVQNKEDLHYNTTITDYWGRALSFQLINAVDGGPGYTWSSIADQPDYQNGNWPMPIAVADARHPGEILISLNTTVYEFNPWEMGSHDPTLYGFVPIKYVGSEFQGGVLPEDQACVNGFDNAGYVMGTSSTLFNQVILNLSSMKGIPSLLKDALEAVLGRIGREDEDIADWSPNPFRGWLSDTNPNAGTRQLTLVDGGEDLQNIPLHPLIQPSRAVDVIFAVDSSADTLGIGANWPNGTALVATYERSLNIQMGNGTAFPSIPDQNTFVNLKLNTRPTFFGCDAANTSSITPLVVYLPNAPYSYGSNVSTFQADYPKEQQRGIVQNGYNVVTMGNGTVDPEWPTCLGCAILSRSLTRTKTKVPDSCTKCFSRYCWNGQVNSSTPAPYEPGLILRNGSSVASAGPGSGKKGAASGLNVPTTMAIAAAALFSFVMM